MKRNKKWRFAALFWQVYGALCENKEKWPSFICYYFCLPPSVPPACAHFLIYRWALTQHTHLSRFRLHLEGKNNNNFLIAEIKFAIPVFRSFSLLTRAHIFICLLSTVFLFSVPLPHCFASVQILIAFYVYFDYLSISKLSLSLLSSLRPNESHIKVDICFFSFDLKNESEFFSRLFRHCGVALADSMGKAAQAVI